MAKRGFDMDDDMQLLDGDELPRVSTGNAGLDDILGGGIDPKRMYLFEGQPGSGKKTLALEFLLEGVRAGEPTLYITLSETEQELGLVAKRHGWSLKGMTIFEFILPETTLDPSQVRTVLRTAEMVARAKPRKRYRPGRGVSPGTYCARWRRSELASCAGGHWHESRARKSSDRTGRSGVDRFEVGLSRS